MIDYGYWVSTEYATFGIFSRDNIIITDAAPIAKWSIGKSVIETLWWYKKNKGATIKRLWKI